MYINIQVYMVVGILYYLMDYSYVLIIKFVSFVWKYLLY